MSSAVDRLIGGRSGPAAMIPLTQDTPDLTLSEAYEIQRLPAFELVATNTAAEVMGSPVNSLAWLANSLGRAGRTLRAGDVVLTGSVSKVLRPRRGDAARACFTRIGSVSCRFV